MGHEFMLKCYPNAKKIRKDPKNESKEEMMSIMLNCGTFRRIESYPVEGYKSAERVPTFKSI